MAYIPPHKRHSKDSKRPIPTPELMVPQLRRNLNLRHSKHDTNKSGKIVYAENAICRWFVVGLDADNKFPSSVHLEYVSLEAFEQRMGEKPLVLVNNHHPAREGETILITPSEFVAVNVWPDLLSSFEIVKSKMESNELDGGKPAIVARFGKNLFYGSPSVSSDTVKKDEIDENSLRQLRRAFHTNVPSSYMANIISGVVPKIGVDILEEKDIYHIKLSDSTQPGSAILCKCRVNADEKLELYKVELNPVRHMVVDISCIDKNLDLRLALYTKRILRAPTENEMQSIRNIVNAAIIDPEVKGGLRWSLGKSCSGDRYAVIAAWHTITNKYKSSSLSLKVRHADRFDFKTAIGEATTEVSLKFKSLVSNLQEEKAERDLMSDMFKDHLRLIWDHFLCSEQYFDQNIA